MKLYIASDHGGFELKEEIKKHLEEKGQDVVDLGTDSNESVDYPDFGLKLSEEVAKNKDALGILICGTGLGMCITANKVKGIRATSCHNIETAKKAKEHNNANVLCLGGRVLEKNEALKIADAFLETPFSEEERHIRRLKKIEELEN